MKDSSLPFWLKVVFGSFNAVGASILLSLWWPKQESHRRWMRLGTLYFLLVWLYMRT